MWKRCLLLNNKQQQQNLPSELAGWLAGWLGLHAYCQRCRKSKKKIK